MEPLRREYLETFIPDGGGAVRFVVADSIDIPDVHRKLTEAAHQARLQVIDIDTGKTRLHMLQFAFFAIAAALDWDALIQARLERLVADAGYAWPQPGQPVPLAALAEHNGVAAMLLRTTLQQQITREVWHDAGLAQDFRKAMMALLDARLADDMEGLASAALDWLRGGLRNVRDVRAAGIATKINRQNARAMLISLCHWLRACRHRGLVVLLDVRQMLLERREIAEGLSYTPAAVMDCYEVIRQVIDDAEHFEGLLLLVLSDARLINDDVPKRALGQYTALKMRVWDDVRPYGRDNPLAPLVVIAP